MEVVDLHHRIDGTGPRLVLLHPIGLDLTCFDALVRELGDGFAMLRVDLRGHGQSAMRPVDQGLDDYAADVHALMQRLRWAPAAVIGVSFGGMVAQHLALRHPADGSGFVIAACASTFSDDVRAAIRERGALAEREGTAAVVESTLARWFTPGFRERGGDEPTRRRLLANDVANWASAWRAIAALDTAPLLASIDRATLCLAGELDQSAPPPIIEAIAARIPGARFQVIPGAPHMLFIEQPRLVADAIRAFVGSLTLE